MGFIHALTALAGLWLGHVAAVHKVWGDAFFFLEALKIAVGDTIFYIRTVIRL